MKTTPKRWIHLGLSAALIGTAGLAACGGEGEGGEQGEAAALGEAGEAGNAAYGEAGEGEGGEGEGEGGVSVTSPDGVRVLPAEKRVAYISGHVATAMALYQAGNSEAAAQHLMQPVSETQPDERAALDALGFDQTLFMDTAAALEDGAEASEIEPQLAAVREQVSRLQTNAGGDTIDIIRFLMQACLDEYQMGVQNNEIVDPAPYEDAYGLAAAARDYARKIESEDAAGLQLELEMLIRMWPNDGPVESALPAPFAQIAAQVARVQLELSTLL